MTGIAVAHRETTVPDGVLVQEAAAGSGVSYGALYDRYASQVFNYALRLTGSPDDAADATQEAFVNVLRRLQDDDRPVLDFSSYLFASARHESYALMRQRARVRPSDSPPEERGRVADVEVDPERAALLHHSQEAVREANARLEPRHREVLALRELAGRSYDDVGQIMGISGNAAAQLIWRARGKLREALTAGAVASVVATSEECESAQQLLNRLQDAEPVEEADRLWLEEHLEQCGSCRAARGMLLEAGASYRSWAPVALLAGMRGDTLTRAGELVGADWSQLTPAGQAAGSGAGGTVAAAAGAVAVAVGIAFLALTGDDELGKIASRGQQPAAGASSPSAQSAPARGESSKARSAAPGAVLAAARAPRSGTPALGKPPTRISDRPDGRAAPESPRAPPRRPDRLEDGSPTPPLGGPGPRGPNPADPRAEPPGSSAPTPVDPASPGPGAPDSAPPVSPVPPAPTPPPPSECRWPGGGQGPAGCPPGQGGVVPGQGGTPPGHPG